MMHLAVSEDDIARAESLVAKAGKDYADSAMFAVADGDTALTARLLAEARSAVSTGAVGSAAWEVAWLRRFDAAEPYARAAAARGDSQGWGAIVLADNLLAQGRWTAADSALVAAVAQSPSAWPRVLRGIMASLPFLAVPRAELEVIRSDLTRHDAALPGGAALGPRSELLPELRTYALALLASRLGEPAEALRLASQLDTARVSEGSRAAVHALAAVVRGDVALAQHRPSEAVTLLQEVKGAVPLDLSGATPFGEDYGRFLRAEALLALGNDAEALRWLENGFAATPDETLFRAQVALRLGDVYERRGEREKAVDQYSRFTRLWKSCDDRLRPAVDEARTRLERLTGEPRT